MNLLCADSGTCEAEGLLYQSKPELIFRECILLCIGTIYWILFIVKHNNAPIHSLTYQCASLSVLAIQ
jgi:hypothetical protein